MKHIVRLLAVASLVAPLSLLAAGDLAEGTVKKIDAPSQRIMLAHGPIENIGMGPMTMMFKVKEPALLKKVKAGDRIRFRVEEIGGEYTVVRIEAAK